MTFLDLDSYDILNPYDVPYHPLKISCEFKGTPYVFSVHKETYPKTIYIFNLITFLKNFVTAFYNFAFNKQIITRATEK